MSKKLLATLTTILILFSTIAIAIQSTSAAPANYIPESAKSGDGASSWTTEEFKFGDWSVKLTSSGGTENYAWVEIPLDMKFTDIASASYWFWYDYTGGGDNPYAFPYLWFALDTGEAIVLEVPGDYKPAEEAWNQWSLDEYDWWHDIGYDTGDLAHFQNKYPDAKVEKVSVEIGYWSVGYGPTTAYVDDITVNTVTYPLEPIVLDKEWYKTGDTVTVTVVDAYEVISVAATVENLRTGQTFVINLPETTTAGEFEGTFTLVDVTPGIGELLVRDGDSFTVTYESLTDSATVNDVAPVVEITDPTDGAFVGGEAVSIVASITEEHPYTISVMVDGVEIATELPATWDTTTYDDGVHTIKVVATDGAGNAGWDSISVKVDNTAPSVTDPTASPPIIIPETATDIILTASVTDDGSGVATVKVDCTQVEEDPAVSMLDDGVDPDAEEGDGIYTAKIEGVTVAEEGLYNLTITASDDVGNVNATEKIALWVIEDTEGPYEVGFTPPAEPICGGLIVRGLYAEDLLTGVYDYVIYRNGSEIAMFTEEELISIEWTRPNGELYGTFNRIAVIDLTEYAGEPVNITVVARDLVENEADEVILYEGVIPEGEWSEMELREGWNLISLPLIPESAAREDVLSLILKQGPSGVIVVYGYDQDIDDWITNPAEMTDGWGYWLYILEYDVMIVDGRETPEPPATPPTYLFTEGWVLAGFKSTTPLSIGGVGGYLESLEELSYFPYVYVWNAAEQSWDMLDTAQELNPGEGFWIWMYEDQYLIPPI